VDPMNKNPFVLALVALVVFLWPLRTQTAQAFSDDCKCNPLKDEETTHWVGNQTHVLIEKRSYRTLRGIVVRPDEQPFGSALVEVFADPKKSEGRRVAACRTGVDGKFCFVGLASGRYELRASSEDAHAGWDVIKMYVVVNPTSENKKDLRILMLPAT
jgi:hypothetical protein